MALIYQFRRLVFAQVLLGIVAFCIAEANPGLLLVAGAMGALSWYVTEGPSGRPLPRWVSNVGALAAVAWLVADLYWQQGDVVIAMGHFTMWLQILLLYTEKSNREYGQLLVLSLMLMIGASVLSVSMIYGVMLAAYCVLALVTVLLFQLKMTSDLVLEANRSAAPARVRVTRPRPVIGRGHRWHFRFLALTIGLICAGVAVAVFVVTPRSGDPKLQGPKGETLASKQTGFSGQVRLDGSAPSEGRKEAVLNLRITLHGANIGDDDQPWLLRGAALDRYDRESHTWRRGSFIAMTDRSVDLDHNAIALAPTGDEQPLEAQITLRQGGNRALFTLHVPPAWIGSESLSQVQFNPTDFQLSSPGASGPLVYTLRGPMHWADNVTAQYEQALPPDTPGLMPRSRGGGLRRGARYARGWDVQTAKLAQHVQHILEPHGLQRDPELPHSPDDQRIATILADHLRENYRYSLENPPVAAHQDPVIEFLFNRREGHCELFAAGLAAMCRSINIPARLVTGYRASEYNLIGGYYVVRESNAHAWTEVHCGPEHGWLRFDATPPDRVRAEHRVERNLLTTIREIYEHLEYAWIRSVVAFDQRTQEKVMGDIRTTISTAARDDQSWLGNLIAFVADLPNIWRLDRTSYTLAGVIIVLISIAIGSLVRTLVIRRRRMAALQLNAVPRARRRGMIRRLRFYLTMLDMLERHGYVRPQWQSPFSFAQELAEANPMRFDPVVALTELFYEIRFGHRELNTNRKTRIRAHLRQLEHALASPRR